MVPLVHPFVRIRRGQARRLAVPVAVAALGTLLVIDGIVERGPGWLAFARLVLAATPERAAAELGAWTADDRARIATVARVDLAFGLLYASLLALAAVAAARAVPGASARRAGSGAAWVCTSIFLLDLPENLAYLSLVRGRVAQPWPALAASCAALRTLLLAAVLWHVARALRLARLARRRPTAPSPPPASGRGSRAARS